MDPDCWLNGRIESLFLPVFKERPVIEFSCLNVKPVSSNAAGDHHQYGIKISSPSWDVVTEWRYAGDHQWMSCTFHVAAGAVCPDNKRIPAVCHSMEKTSRLMSPFSKDETGHES